MEIKYTIPLQPRIKKNSQQILINRKTGRPFVAQSDRYKRYEKDVLPFLRPKPPEPINTPVCVKCLFYLETRRKTDLTNLLEAIDDILVKHGILIDDNYTIIASHDGSRCFYDKENPRTEITIKSIEEAEEIVL